MKRYTLVSRLPEMQSAYDLNVLLNLYPESDKMKIKISWSNRHLSKYYKIGWKYCSTCGYLIHTNLLFCRKCGLKFRTRNRFKGHKGGDK